MKPAAVFVFFLLVFQGCATAPPRRADTPVVPLSKVNLEAVLEEHEG